MEESKHVAQKTRIIDSRGPHTVFLKLLCCRNHYCGNNICGNHCCGNHCDGKHRCGNLRYGNHCCGIIAVDVIDSEFIVVHMVVVETTIFSIVAYH